MLSDVGLDLQLVLNNFQISLVWRIEKADSVTKRIGQSIVDHAKVTFSSNSRGSKELWEKVRQITKKE